MNVRAFLGVILAAVSVAGCANQNPTSRPPAASPPTTRHGMRVLPLTGTTPVDFAKYIVEMHKRIHAEFSDKELGRLDGLAPADPANDKRLRTRVELAVSASDGRLVRADVGDGSGVAAFDAAAIEALRRAEPFGPPPPAIVSSDGNVHIDWVFGRDEVYACAPTQTRPLLLGR